MTIIGKANISDPPHVNEIRDCEETVEVNRLALVRLLMISERSPRINGSDSTAKNKAFDALGVEGICRKVNDIEL